MLLGKNSRLFTLPVGILFFIYKICYSHSHSHGNRMNTSIRMTEGRTIKSLAFFFGTLNWQNKERRPQKVRRERDTGGWQWVGAVWLLHKEDAQSECARESTCDVGRIMRRDSSTRPLNGHFAHGTRPTDYTQRHSWGFFALRQLLSAAVFF